MRVTIALDLYVEKPELTPLQVPNCAEGKNCLLMFLFFMHTFLG